MFYGFDQNNSGGKFEEINDSGYVNLIVEADSAVEANSIAEEYGVYFNGCESNRDCSCCGDRWYAVDDNDGEEKIEDIYFYNNDNFLIVRKVKDEKPMLLN